MTTIGTIGLDLKSCAIKSFDSDDTGEDDSAFNLQFNCFGKFAVYESLDWGIINESDTTYNCKYLDTSNLDKTSNQNLENEGLMEVIDRCEGQGSCEFTTDEAKMFFTDDNALSGNRIYMSMTCYESKIEE